MLWAVFGPQFLMVHMRTIPPGINGCHVVVAWWTASSLQSLHVHSSAANMLAHRKLVDVRRPDRPATVRLDALAPVHAGPLHAAPRGSAVLYLHLRVTGSDLECYAFL